MAKLLTTSNILGASGLIVATLLANCVIKEAPPAYQPAQMSPEQQQQQPAAYAESSPNGQHAPRTAMAASPGVPPLGDYRCSFTQGGYQYPPFACKVYANNDGSVSLEKLSGSQRIRGLIRHGDNRRFSFEGTFFCPYGSCTQEVRADFDTIDNGLYRGAMRTRTGTTWVTLDYLPDGAGGMTYGGASYGGASYGGWSYGGRGYGGRTYGGRGVRNPF